MNILIQVISEYNIDTSLIIREIIAILKKSGSHPMPPTVATGHHAHKNNENPYYNLQAAEVWYDYQSVALNSHLPTQNSYS